jgi:hypothetical protein
MAGGKKQTPYLGVLQIPFAILPSLDTSSALSRSCLPTKVCIFWEECIPAAFLRQDS